METAEVRDVGVVAGIFRDRMSAANAVSGLLDAHFDPPYDLSVIRTHRRSHRKVPIREHTELGEMSALGAKVGALVGVAVGLLMVLGVLAGPASFAAAGWAAPLVGATAAGIVAGAALGAVVGLTHWQDEAMFQTSPDAGPIWVGVHASGARATEAREILRAAGARHFQG